MDENVKIKLLTQLEHTSANIYDLYYSLYVDYVVKYKDDILKEVILGTQSRKFDDNGESSQIDKALVDKIKKQYSSILEGIVNVLVDEKKDEETFYKELYNRVFQSPTFPLDDTEKSVLLYLLCEENMELPYYSLEGVVHVEKKEFKEIVKRIDSVLYKVTYIMSRQFADDVQRMAYIYHLMGELEDEKEKVVYLYFVSIFMKRIENGMDKSEE